MRRAVDPATWGVQTGYEDASGVWQTPSPAAVAAVLDALDADGAGPPLDGAPLIVRGQVRRQLTSPAEIVLEDGTVLPAASELPPGLPLGYHTLRNDQGTAPLIVTPGRCFLPRQLRTFGWAVQLYALRSAASWGHGDLADLSRLARWSAMELGAGMLLVNPLHATVPVTAQECSPYYASSRRFRNPLYLRIEDVPGAAELGDELDSLARAGRALNRQRTIDRDAVFLLKLDALWRIWARRPPSQRLLEGDDALVSFATHCALAETQGASWRGWAAPLRDPYSSAVASFRQEQQDRIAFFAWLQGLIDVQLAAASAHLAVMHDLGVGVDPDGADAWMWQHVLAGGVHVGAPPDPFNQLGQDWALAPFDPWKLRASGYQPFVETIRAGLRHAGALRLDHVMGLFRLFWIPAAATAAHGVYVRQPATDLLDILALESHRAGAYICGEDLGTVEPQMRRELAGRRILSYRVLWFEDGPPSTFPEQAMAAVTTHDLPTIAGLWSGAVTTHQLTPGRTQNPDVSQALRDRLAALTGLDAHTDVDDAVLATYRALAEAPSMVLTATLEDALSVVEQPNVPGTVDTWPNWRLALPSSLEELTEDPRPRRIAAALRRD